jgi:anti-sigma factor RsiW
MNCSRALRLLQRLLDGDLPEPRAADLCAHLDTCAACADEYATLHHLDQALAGEPTVDPPAHLARAIARRAAARRLVMKRVLLPAWLEALTLGGTAIALGVGGFVAVTLLSVSFDLHLTPAVTAAAVASIIAAGLAAFASSFYRAEV